MPVPTDQSDASLHWSPSSRLTLRITHLTRIQVPAERTNSSATVGGSGPGYVHGSSEAELRVKMPELAHVLRDLSPFLACADATSGDHKNPALKPLPDAISTQAATALAQDPDVRTSMMTVCSKSLRY